MAGRFNLEHGSWRCPCPRVFGYTQRPCRSVCGGTSFLSFRRSSGRCCSRCLDRLGDCSYGGKTITPNVGLRSRRNRRRLVLGALAILLVTKPPNKFGRERRERVSQQPWCGGGGCFDSRRRVNSDVV